MLVHAAAGGCASVCGLCGQPGMLVPEVLVLVKTDGRPCSVPLEVVPMLVAWAAA